MCGHNRRGRRQGPITALALAGYAAYRQHQAQKQGQLASQQHNMIPGQEQHLGATQQTTGLYDYSNLLSALNGAMGNVPHGSTRAPPLIAASKNEANIYDEKHQVQQQETRDGFFLNNEHISDQPPTYYAYEDEDPATRNINFANTIPHSNNNNNHHLSQVHPTPAHQTPSSAIDTITKLLSQHNVIHNSQQLNLLITSFATTLQTYHARRRQGQCANKCAMKRARRALVDGIIAQESAQRGGGKITGREKKAIRISLNGLQEQLEGMMFAERY